MGIMRATGGPGGEAKDLSSYIERIPELVDRPVVLDAAIRAALGSPGTSLAAQRERAARLKARFPEQQTEIERTLWLNRIFDAPARPSERRDDEPPPPALGPPLADGSRRYALREPIGSGVNGRVYLAEDRLLSGEGASARVAVKLLRKGSALNGERARAEARRMRLVEHANVVRVSDTGSTPDGRSFIVQEYIDGRNLGLWLEARGPSLRFREIVRIIAEVADGVQAIHAAGLVHHDLKPQNVLIGSDGSVKVVDFGSASWQGRSAGSRQASPGPGTLAFMAPERVRLLDSAPMPSSDVFSLGAMLHWALTRTPVAGESTPSAIAVIADRSAEFERLDERLRRAGVDRDLRLVIERAVSTRIEDRHPSAGALAQDLRAWLARKPIAWTKPGVVHRSGLLVRRRPLALAACAAIAASLGVAAHSARTAHLRDLVAQENAHQVEIEKEKFATATEYKQKAKQALMRLLASFNAAKQHNLASEVLTSLWIVEYAQGPLILNDPTELDAIWAKRVEVLEARRDELIDAGLGDSVGARMLEPSLGLWYLRAGRESDALALLDTAVPAWERWCSAGDPMLEQLRALRAVAIVRLARGGGDAVPSEAEVGEAQRLLLAYRPEVATEKPIASLVNEALSADRAR